MTHPAFVFALADATLAHAGRTVLAHVDWTVHQGEQWFVVGPNGSGKTTLLHALLGLQPLHAGTLRRDPLRGTRQAIGFVPQRCDLAADLPTTVREFVALGMVGVTVPRHARSERVREALADVELGPHIDHAYSTLSGGQRQRALIARALTRHPATLLADEPTTGLDLRAQTELIVALRRRRGQTLVFVTHDLGLAAQHASHVALVHNGTLRAGPRQDVLQQDALVAVYGDRVAAALATALAQPS